MDLRKIGKSLVLSVLTLLLSVTVLYAASTIGANIVTTGTLSVTGASTLTGAVTAASTVDVTGATTLTSATLSSTLKVGTSGTAHTKFMSGTCTASLPSATMAATTSQEWICTATGVAANDVILATLNRPTVSAATPPSTIDQTGLMVIGTRATTSNAFGVTVLNLTGAATTTGTGYTSVNYWIADS